MVSGEIEDIYIFFLGGGGGVRVGETRLIMGDIQMPTQRRVIVKYSHLLIETTAIKTI